MIFLNGQLLKIEIIHYKWHVQHNDDYTLMNRRVIISLNNKHCHFH